MHSRCNRLLHLAVIAVAGGTCFQFGGCVPDLTHYVANFNPCGTILNCDPTTYSFIRSGYEGPGADPDVDPACTYPPYCNRTNPGSDPFSPP